MFISLKIRKKWKDRNQIRLLIMGSKRMVFIPQIPKFSLERVILPPSVKEDVLLSLTLIENQKRIYEDWGFEEVDAKPKLILNFYGPTWYRKDNGFSCILLRC